MENDDFEKIREILAEVQLSQFFTRIRDDLQVTKLSHFDYVKLEDLENIGFGKPAARRLLDAVKRRKTATWRRNLVSKIFAGSLSYTGKSKEVSEYCEKFESDLTCLIQEQDINLGPKLGDGSFGVVRGGEWSASNGQKKKVAVKILKQDVFHVQGVLEDFMREVKAMHALSHPNLIRLYGIVLSNPLMMVTELAERGALLDYLRKVTPFIPLTTLCDYARQIANGMMYLERCRFIHRDLAARNVFMASSDVLKIGDFGLVRSLSQQQDCYIMSEDKKVPFPWCAPESLKYKQFSHFSDVWMFGVTVWEIFSFGEDPWVGLTGQQILRKIDSQERLHCPTACPMELYDLLLKCWLLNPNERPMFELIYKQLSSFALPFVKATRANSEEDKLSVEVGDEIIVIDGKSENYWWRGQNQRTCQLGEFPRCIVNILRPIDHRDISKPLNDSFIHTGHGGIKGESWGSPNFIDDIFLKVPKEPQDKISKLSRPPRGKHNSLKLKKNDKQQFNYCKLNEKWPDDVNLKEKIKKNKTNSEMLLIDFSENLNSRQRSYSATDLRGKNTDIKSQCWHPELGSVTSLLEMPKCSLPFYTNIKSDGLSENGTLPHNNTLRLPVRPSPPPPTFQLSRPSPPAIYSNSFGSPDDFGEEEWDAESQETIHYNNSNAMSAVSSQDLPRIYDEVPLEYPVDDDLLYTNVTSSYKSPLYNRCDIESQNHADGTNNCETISLPHSGCLEEIQNNCDKTFQISDLNDKISNMWISSVIPDDNSSLNKINSQLPSVSFSTVTSVQNLSETCLVSAVPKFSCISNIPNKSLMSASNNTNPVIFPVNLAESQASSLEKKPKFEKEFIEELEKTLGQNHVVANTFLKSSDKSSVMALPFSPLKQLNVSVSCSLSSTLTNSYTVSSAGIKSVDKYDKNIFSDFDILNSSRSLGLLPKQPVDMAKYFPKTAHVKPFVHVATSLPSNNHNETLNNLVWPCQSRQIDNNYVFDKMHAPVDAFNVHSTITDTEKKKHDNQYKIGIVQGCPTNLDKTLTTNKVNLLPWNADLSSNMIQSSATSDVFQPALVLSPQLTVNYNQMVCSSGGGGDPFVSHVAAAVPGTNEAAARQALHISCGDFQGAVQYLKVEKLYRLGIASKADCHLILEQNCWELERSASVLLDKFA